ncbi:MAG: Clp1/GlmU family protein [Armatimonadota bacterium]
MSAKTDLPWDIPPSWRPALDAAAQGAVIFIIGEVDSGKTTLAAALANAAIVAGRRTAVVDADVGQSSVGPPACVGLALPTRSFTSLDDLVAHQIDFVGACSPAAHLLQVTTSTSLLTAAARSDGCETIVIDTGGMVSGGLARALKVAKIRLTDPDVIVALQSEDEVDHLVSAYRARSRPHILRLRISRHAQQRSREERMAYRQRRFAAYLKGGKVIDIAWHDAPAENSPWTTGEPAPGHVAAYAEEQLGCEVLFAERRADGVVLIVRGQPDPAGLRGLRDSFGATPHVIDEAALDHLLIGLLGKGGDTLSIGIIERMDFRKRRLSVYTPLADGAQVCGLRLGSLRIARDGSQLASL